MGSQDFEADVARIAALREPVRRALYRYVASQAEPVSRERAAAGVGVPHHIAKFHLDKLEEDGLLDVEYARPPGRRGPGAGRPAKLYRRTTRDIAVTVPERHYDLAARVLAEAITAAQATGTPVAEAIAEAARAAGSALAEQALAEQARADGAPAAGDVTGILAGNGYEPRVTGDEIILANCPFHRLAADHPDLVCGMNLDLVDGLLGALPPAGLCARLDPAPGRCCVVIGPGPPATARASGR